MTSSPSLCRTRTGTPRSRRSACSERRSTSRRQESGPQQARRVSREIPHQVPLQGLYRSQRLGQRPQLPPESGDPRPGGSRCHPAHCVQQHEVTHLVGSGVSQLGSHPCAERVADHNRGLVDSHLGHEIRHPFGITRHIHPGRRQVGRSPERRQGRGVNPATLRTRRRRARR